MRHTALPLLFLAGAAAEPAMAITYYVATNGSNSNSGKSIDAPFLTVQKAANVVLPGDTVMIRGGIYRESVESIRGGTAAAPVTFQNYPGEVATIMGSKVVTGWVSDGGSVWKKTGWVVNSQQVFVDFATKPGKSLQQIGMPSGWYGPWEYPAPVGSNRASMIPGSFYYSPAEQTLYVWLADGSDPNAHVMEASTQMRLFTMHQPYMRLKGIKFRHSNYSASAQQGAAVELSSYSVADGIDVQYVDFAGISMGYLQNGAVAQNVIANNNGSVGIMAAGSTNFRVTNAVLQFNNRRNFNQNWHAGGFKGASNTYGIVENCEVGVNNGPGIWFDHARSGQAIIVRNNFVHDNTPGEGAIFMEASKNGLVYNNVLVNNLRRGIYLSASDNNQVYNNTIVGTKERAGIEVNGMPRAGMTLTNNTLSNNSISSGTTVYDLYIYPSDGYTVANNTSDYNNFYRSSGVLALRYASNYTSLQAWQDATGFDRHSRSATPSFVGPSGTPPGYAVKAGSVLIDGGKNLGAMVPNDFKRVARPAGGAFDIGAYEFVATP
ncbi:MAG TPA: right-handed parallel beta-helix repeat-containing protein [Burkholderiales bacterium]|nr:right-handed parallel beta-helix repeat-containing protein [Burkholderiales bacterium]